MIIIKLEIPKDIYERIAYVRRYFDKSQQDFGEKICVTYSAISLIERKKREPSDRIIRDICREFNINEDWLREGTGGIENMLASKDMVYLSNIGNLGKEKNEFKKFYLNMMMNMPDEYWNYIYGEFKKFCKKNEE